MIIHTLDLNFQDTPRAIASYLVIGPGGPVLVETGPGSTLPTLLWRLAERGYTPADIHHLLVTHIHLDHAGAAGWWAQQGTQVYVHHVGAPHLIDPSRLLSSAGRIYGDQMDKLWGQTLPAPAERITNVYDGDRVEVAGLTFIALDTPGHATHHHTYRLGDVAFTGDAAGVRIAGGPLLDVTAPPPEFDLEAWQRTLDRLLAESVTVIYPTHFGRVDGDVQAHLEAYQVLLNQTADFVRERMTAGLERDEILRQFLAWYETRAIEAGLDPALIPQYEIANPHYMSVDGILRYWRKHQAINGPPAPIR
ncbi:MAG: MBL fold metallo-hydrolase [Chloroflexota bacterium]